MLIISGIIYIIRLSAKKVKENYSSKNSNVEAEEKNLISENQSIESKPKNNSSETLKPIIEAPNIEDSTSNVRYLKRPNPLEIVQKVEGMPLLQRESVAKHYVGLKVDWEVTIFSAHKLKNNLIRLMMRNQKSYPWIYCEIDVSDYPEINIAEKGQKINVKGEIAFVKGHDIELINCELLFV